MSDAEPPFANRPLGDASPRICVVGAGAVGGLIGARLARTPARVTLVDRGPRLEALESSGLTVVDPDGARATVEDVRVTGDTADAGRQDLVVLAVKTYDLSEAARKMPPLLGPETLVLPVQNGIPWWYFHGIGGPHEGRRLESVDPEGVIAANIDPERVVGCVPYMAADVPQPGVVRHREGGYLPVGEPGDSRSRRAEALAELLEDAGFRSRVLEDVRSEIWLKAWGSLSFNPVSALTGATLAGICRDPGARGLVRAMMEEARAVGEALGVSFRRSIDRRIAGAEAVGEHETSMLQDLERGRPLELDALVGSVVELADLTGHPVPRIEAVYVLAQLRAETRSEGTAAAPRGEAGTVALEDGDRSAP